MPKGGARNRSGPPPDPNALRRERDAGDWVHLPVSRQTPAPEWPLTRIRKREEELWRVEWARPQAVMWEANGQELEVALYVRSLADAEANGASVSSRTLVKQQMDALGLTIPGLARNRWVIGSEPRRSQQPKSTASASARDRLKLLEGSA